MSKACESNIDCACQRKGHETKKIVITGGPGSGKTAILEIAKRNFCEHVAILPEAASILFGGGFWRSDSIEARKAAQRTIYVIQGELEHLAEVEGNYGIVLCDRGTLDGLAYWPNSTESFFDELKTTRDQELSRYAAIIHLRTPALEQGYNHQNPVRTESAMQARELDRKIMDAWQGHPNCIVIESTDDFLAKVEKAVGFIKKELPECCKQHRVKELT